MSTVEEAEPQVEQTLSRRKRKAQESWQSRKGEKKSKVELVDNETPINPLVGEVPKKPKKKTVATETDAVSEAAKPEKKKRFTLFMGNLSYKTTVEDITAHIKPTGVVPTGVRLQTDPVTKKPKGFAFIDLADAMSLDKVLNLHHTSLAGRKINIELTAGGGGSGEKRKAKIMKKNEKLDVERDTAQKSKREKEAKKVREGGSRSNGEQSEATKQKREQEMGDVNPARRRRIK